MHSNVNFLTTCM